VSPAIGSLAATSLRKGNQPIYIIKITITGGTTGTVTKTIYLSDHYNVYEDYVPVRGLVDQWMRFEWGRGRIDDYRYSIPDAQVTLLADNFGGLMSDDGMTRYGWADFLSFIRYWPLVNATIEVYLTFADMDTPIEVMEPRFIGRVYSVAQITPNKITCRARADPLSERVVNATTWVGNSPDLRMQDNGEPVPLIAGVIGFDRDRHFLIGRDDTTAIDSDVTSWELAGMSYGAAPYGRVINNKAEAGQTIDLRVNSIPITTDAAPGGGRIVAGWSGIAQRPVAFPELETGHYTVADAEIGIPAETNTDWGGPSVQDVLDGDIIIQAAHYPSADPTSWHALTRANYTDYQNCVDFEHIETYCEDASPNINNPLAPLEQVFIKPPIGDNDTDTSDPRSVHPDSGGKHYVFALIYCEGSPDSDFRLRILWNGGSQTSGTDYHSLADGYHWLTMELDQTTFANTIDKYETWGTDSSDHFGCWVDGASGTLWRCFLLGISVMWAPNQTGISDASRHAMFMFQGKTDDTGLSDYSPGEVLRRMMIDSSDGELAASDFNLSSTEYGGFGKFRTAINGSIAYNTGTTGKPGQLAFVEPKAITLGEIISRVQRDVFCSVWRDPTDGKYNIRLRKHGANPNDDYDGNDLTLRPHNLWSGGDGGDTKLQLSYTDERRVYNAITMDYLYDYHVGRYLRRVKIDNSNEGSEDWSGSSASNWENAAQDAQDEFGLRRELRLQSKIISDPLTAWDACVRMFEILAYPRPVLRFVCDYWGLQLGHASVFKVASDMEDVFTWPGPVPWLGLDNWEDGDWWVTRIRESVYGGFEVEAVDLREI
jgi:hypothetical protein